MFYQCPKCKKTWQHPLSQCPDCFSPLQRLKEGRITKVIGISKVTIPTLLHPKVPYFVLVLEDENGNRWTHKSFRKYKIGEKFNIEPIPGKKTVGVWRVKYDAQEAIAKAVYLIGGLQINQDSKVLILPTLISPQHPYFSENTSPGFLEGMINFLLQKGVSPSNIKVAGQSFNRFPIEASVEKSQLLKVCLQNKITPLDLAKTNFTKKETGDIVFEVTEEVFNQDILINLPILKLDSELKVKGAADNVLKLLNKDSYLSLKYLYEHSLLITEIQKILPSFITVAEAISVQKADKFTTFLGLVLAGFNPLYIERVFAEIAAKKDLPDYLKNIKIGDIPIAGREIKEVQYNVEKFY